MSRKVESRKVEWPRSVPTPLLRASAGLHLGAGAVTLIRPQVWPWALATVLLDQLVVTAAGLWPKSRLLGPNWSRLPARSAARREIAITIDDGPDPRVTPEVLSQLASFGARASFFCVGERIERYPDLAQEIVRCGHTIENHTQHHRHSFSLLGPGVIRSEIARAQECIARVTGSSPRFFRAPAGLRNAFLEPQLRRLQLLLVSWTHRGFDTVSANPDAVYLRLVSSLKSGDILLLHDGNAAQGRGGVPTILKVLPRVLETLQTEGLAPITLRAAL